MNPPSENTALKQKIVRSSADYVIARALTGGLGVVASLWLYRVLGPEEAGRFQFILAAGMTAGVVAGLGLNEMLARFIPGAEDQRARALFRGALTRVLLALGVVALLVFGLVEVAGAAPLELRRVSVFFVVFVTAYALYSLCLGMLRGRGRLQIIPVLDLGANFGSKIAALAAVLAVPAFTYAFGAYAMTQAVTMLAAVFILRRWLGPSSGALPREESSFTRLILLVEIIRILSTTVDIYLLRLLTGPLEVGLFAAGARLTRVVEFLVLSPIAVPLLYYFSHPESSAMRGGIVERGTRLVGSAMGLAALVVAALAEPIVLIFLGEGYRESVGVARLFVAHAVGVGMLIFMVPLYNSISRPQYAAVQGGAALLLNLVLSWILVPRFGALGAAAGGVTAVIVTLVGAVYFIHRRLGIDVRQTVGVLLVLYSAAYAVVLLGHPALGVLLFAAGLLPLKLLQRDDLKLLKQSRSSRLK